MMYGWYGDPGFWGWVLMGIMMMLFWGGVAALVVFLIRGSRGGHDLSSDRQDDPERILNQRFARGEIDETEFKARRDALKRNP